MIRLPFVAGLDVPLAIVTWGLFVLNFHFYSKTNPESGHIDLRARLPQAYFRITAFFVVVLGVCWAASFGFWVLYVALWVLGMVLGLIGGNQISFGELMVVGTAGMLREWSFGFPNLILSPPTRSGESEAKQARLDQYVGMTATTESALKPTGKIWVDECSLSAISMDGDFIAPGVEVAILEIRNGNALVRLADSN